MLIQSSIIRKTENQRILVEQKGPEGHEFIECRLWKRVKNKWHPTGAHVKIPFEHIAAAHREMEKLQSRANELLADIQGQIPLVRKKMEEAAMKLMQQY